MEKYDVAAFVWPSYTGDEPRTDVVHYKKSQLHYNVTARMCSPAAGGTHIL